MNNTQIVQGSLSQIAAQNGKSIAETFLNADVVILVDTSGSMNTCDARGGKPRYDVACEELKTLQSTLPGKIAVLAFSSDVQFCPSGIPFQFDGMTDLGKALKFAKVADVTGMRFIVISDGEPDSEDHALNVAKTYKNRIDTIFVGSEGGAGQAFLKKLAKASGGQGVTSAQVKELAPTIAKLLTA